MRCLDVVCDEEYWPAHPPPQTTSFFMNRAMTLQQYDQPRREDSQGDGRFDVMNHALCGAWVDFCNVHAKHALYGQ